MRLSPLRKLVYIGVLFDHDQVCHLAAATIDQRKCYPALIQVADDYAPVMAQCASEWMIVKGAWNWCGSLKCVLDVAQKPCCALNAFNSIQDRPIFRRLNQPDARLSFLIFRP